MLNKIAFAVVFIVLVASASLAQSRTMYVGNVELRLGMSRDATMKLLSNYDLTVMGSGFNVTKYYQLTKRHDLLGEVAFEQDQLS
jgi:hypothetical protein